MLDVALRILDRADANTGAQNQCGDTALIFACDRKMPDVALRILDRPDVNVGAQDQKGRTVLCWARKRKMPDMVIRRLDAGSAARATNKKRKIDTR